MSGACGLVRVRVQAERYRRPKPFATYSAKWAHILCLPHGISRIGLAFYSACKLVLKSGGLDVIGEDVATVLVDGEFFDDDGQPLDNEDDDDVDELRAAAEALDAVDSEEGVTPTSDNPLDKARISPFCTSSGLR